MFLFSVQYTFRDKLLLGSNSLKGGGTACAVMTSIERMHIFSNTSSRESGLIGEDLTLHIKKGEGNTRFPREMSEAICPSQHVATKVIFIMSS